MDIHRNLHNTRLYQMGHVHGITARSFYLAVTSGRGHLSESASADLHPNALRERLNTRDANCTGQSAVESLVHAGVRSNISRRASLCFQYKDHFTPGVHRYGEEI